MILKTKDEILNWLKKYDREYKTNMENNAYEFIDLHDINNKALFNEMIKKDSLPDDYFENLRTNEHQYIVNVKGNVNLSKKKLKEISIQFYHVDGYFDCSSNYLESLKGSPQYVGRDFYCAYNQLTSLKGCPQSISGDFYCAYNQLTSLKGCPQSISGNFYCDYNQLTSLEYFPTSLNGIVFIKNNTGLLKYKNENISDEKFFDNQEYDFWYQIHLQEKAIKENQKIFDNLNLQNIIDDNQIKIQKKKL